jgi:DAHL domain/Enoyl-CoA hydratase/isomerase
MRRVWQPLAIVASLLLLFTYLLIQSKSPDLALRARMQDALQSIQLHDTELTRDILLARAGLLPHYDALPQTGQHLWRALEALHAESLIESKSGLKAFDCYGLSEIIGPRRGIRVRSARRMVLTGELMDAPEAQRIGLLDWVVPESELDATVARLTEQLLKGARTAQGLSKRLVTESFHTSFEEVREMYLEYQARALAAPEHRAAMDEYLQMQAKRHQEKQP